MALLPDKYASGQYDPLTGRRKKQPKPSFFNKPKTYGEALGPAMPAMSVPQVQQQPQMSLPKTYKEALTGDSPFKVQQPAGPQSLPAGPMSREPAVPQVQQQPSEATLQLQKEAENMRKFGTPIAPEEPAIPQAQELTPQETPVAPETSKAQQAYNKALSAYNEALKISPEALSTQEQLDRLIESTRKGYQDIKEQTIPMRFITGQLQSVEERALNLAEPLERKLARLEAKRKGALESSKFALERAESQMAREQAGSTPQVVKEGETIVQFNPQTGQYEELYAPTEEETRAGFTLSPGEVRYDAQGNVIATGPEKAVEEGETSPYAKTIAQRTLNQVEEAIDLVGPLTTGLGATLANIPGTKAKDLEGIIDTIKGNIGFGELTAMREASKTGGALGQVSEREIDLLTSVLGSLNRYQTPETIKQNLRDIQRHFENWQATVTLKENVPEEVVNEIMRQLPDAEPTEILEAYNELGFSQVEADTNKGLNRPQRNNNPGNVKRGGVADQFALKNPDGSVKTDEQGHLIFPSSEAGFEGLRADLQAKLSGNSRFVGANPTIAELGKAYAEDPNWPRSVARILGVSPNTRTNQLNFNNLLQAIARQEGFFA